MPRGRRPYDPYMGHYHLFQCGHQRNMCIALTTVALHDLEVKAADVLNAYMMEPNHEKIWTVVGPEFGDNAGRSAVIVRALYGLKSVGA